MTDRFHPFRVANDLLDEPARLREVLDEEGYLFFRGLGPRDRLLDVRRDILALCRDAGWIDPAAGPLEARWSGAGPFTEGDPEYMAIYKKVVHLPSFDALPEDPRLTELAGRVLGGEVQVHKLRIARIVFPHNTAQTVAPHQDYHYIRGTPETYTLWMPLGDCPEELGGLAVLRGSHRGGFTEHVAVPGKKFAGHGLTPDLLPAGERAWHTGPFGLGDVLMFHSFTIHQAMPNRTDRTLRLSTDDRYQLRGGEIALHSLQKHYNL